MFSYILFVCSAVAYTIFQIQASELRSAQSSQSSNIRWQCASDTDLHAPCKFLPVIEASKQMDYVWINLMKENLQAAIEEMNAVALQNKVSI